MDVVLRVQVGPHLLGRDYLPSRRARINIVTLQDVLYTLRCQQRGNGNRTIIAQIVQ